MVDHLKNKFPQDINEVALEILLDNEIGGRAFLKLTVDGLKSDGMKSGPASVINDYVQELKR